MNMRIPFRTPIVKGDITMQAVTVAYRILQADQVLVYLPNGEHKALPIAGLSATTKAALTAFDSALSADIADEYQTGAVTARAIPQGAEE